MNRSRHGGSSPVKVCILGQTGSVSLISRITWEFRLIAVGFLPWRVRFSIQHGLLSTSVSLIGRALDAERPAGWPCSNQGRGLGRSPLPKSVMTENAMPCSDSLSHDQSLQKERDKRLQQVTQMLCALCKASDPSTIQSVPGLQEWWKHHQKHDKKEGRISP